MEFKGKKILFIGTGFFDYEDCLIQELERRGADVFYFSSAITSIYKRFLIRIGKVEKGPVAVSKSLMYLINKQPNDIDVIFVIKAENFREEHFSCLKEKYPKAVKILYLWDSLQWLQNKDLLLSFFDKVLSFDRRDAESYHLFFRPLFYREVSNENNKIEYDISFVGSSHTIRYKLLKSISEQLEAEGVSYRFVLRTGRFSLFMGRYLTHSILKNSEDWFITVPIKYDEYLRISKNSNVILDIANPCQTGLTMRTIETIGLGKKILTTNPEISKYGFNSDNYSIINVENPIVDIDFVKRRNKVIYDISNFTLKKFVDDIFESI